MRSVLLQMARVGGSGFAQGAHKGAWRRDAGAARWGELFFALAQVAHLPACCLSGGQSRPPTGRVGGRVLHPSPREQGHHASLQSPWCTAGFEGSSCMSPGPSEDRTTSGSSVHPRPSMMHGTPREIACCPGTTAGQSVRSNTGYT